MYFSWVSSFFLKSFEFFHMYRQETRWVPFRKTVVVRSLGIVGTMKANNNVDEYVYVYRYYVGVIYGQGHAYVCV